MIAIDGDSIGDTFDMWGPGPRTSETPDKWDPEQLIMNPQMHRMPFWYVTRNLMSNAGLFIVQDIGAKRGLS
jgi:hypothetical protein